MKNLPNEETIRFVKIPWLLSVVQLSARLVKLKNEYPYDVNDSDHCHWCLKPVFVSLTLYTYADGHSCGSLNIIHSYHVTS